MILDAAAAAVVDADAVDHYLMPSMTLQMLLMMMMSMATNQQKKAHTEIHHATLYYFY